MYLAEKYMSGPKADAIILRAEASKKKKKKRTAVSAATRVVSKVLDEDGGWGGEEDKEEMDVSEAVVASDRSFKKRDANDEGSGWVTTAKGIGSPPPEESAAAQETVYRDSSGRRLDMKAERAEAARRKREREEKEAQKMEWGKGLVQREEQERRRLELEKQKTTKFARHADDEEMNEEMKARERWNDPAAAFLTVRIQD